MVQVTNRSKEYRCIDAFNHPSMAVPVFYIRGAHADIARGGYVIAVAGPGSLRLNLDGRVNENQQQKGNHSERQVRKAARLHSSIVHHVFLFYRSIEKRLWREVL